jgi:hypothetical protein
VGVVGAHELRLFCDTFMLHTLVPPAVIKLP